MDGGAAAPPQATQQVTQKSQPRETAIRTGLVDTAALRQPRYLARALQTHDLHAFSRPQLNARA